MPAVRAATHNISEIFEDKISRGCRQLVHDILRTHLCYEILSYIIVISEIFEDKISRGVSAVGS